MTPEIGSDEMTFPALYWFLPLEDHLGVPHGSVYKFPTLRPPLEQHAFAAANGDLVSAAPELQHFQSVLSLFIWQIEESDAVHSPLDAAFAAARRAFPEGEQDRVTESPGAGHARTFTVAEVGYITHDHQEEPDTKFACILEDAVRQIRRLQLAYSFVSQWPLRLLTIETLPATVPFGRGQVGGDNKPVLNDGLAPYTIFHNFHTIFHNFRPLLPSPVLDQGGTDSVAMMLDRDDGVFSGFLESHHDAETALLYRGDARSSVLASATAAEVLLDDLLRHLLWEEGMRPEDAATQIFSDVRATAQPRAARYTADRLGGLWQKDKDGPVKEWQERVARVRDRVIHAGYLPTIAEAKSALDTVNDLQKFAFKQLRRKINEYPHTALAAIGVPVLEKEGRITVGAKRVLETEPPQAWMTRFVRWRAALSREIERSRGLDEPPNPDRALLVVVALPDGSTDWVLHDRESHLATSVNPLIEKLSTEQRRVLQAITAEAAQRKEMLSIVVEIDSPATVPPITNWVEEHRRLPLCEVMVSGEDRY